MKKFKMLIFILLVLFSLIACDNGPSGDQSTPTGSHEHSYGIEWQGDLENHWHECACGDKKDVATHDWKEEIIKQPTEAEEGKKISTCTVCNKEYEEVLPKIVHSHEYSSEWNSDENNHWHECACGDKKDQGIHQGGTATCSSQAICEVCGESYGESLAHNKVENTDSKYLVSAATCTEKAKYYYSCSDCGEILEDIFLNGDTIDHEFSETWENDATNHWRKCINCDEVETEVHFGGSATCSSLAKCEVCGESYGELLAHTEVENTDSKYLASVATCTERASYYYSCSVCESKLDHTFFYGDFADHSYDDTWHKNESIHWKECSCGQENEKSTHTWNQGDVEVEATPTIDGIIVYTCLTCGQEKRQNIGTLNHIHTYEKSWSSDNNGHWLNSTCGHDVGSYAVHSGGIATCQDKAVCNVCGASYGNVLSHKFDKKVIDDYYLASSATCTAKAKYYYSCVCGEKGTNTFTYGDLLQHNYGSTWEKDGNNHWIECDCGKKTQLSVHTGGIATCEEKAKCSICGEVYGSLANHRYEEKNISSKYLASEATCTAKAKYYYSCVCGLADTNTFEYGEALPHTFSSTWNKNDSNHWFECLVCQTKTNLAVHSGGVATETSKAHCGICGQEYGGYLSGSIKYDPNPMTQQKTYKPFSQAKSSDGKMRIVNRNGVPQLMLSALLRTDLLINADFVESHEIEDYFAICKATGMNTIEVVVMWSQIEVEYDKYDFKDIKNYLDYAKKYGLKVNIEWYGSLVDGEAHSNNIPKYITSDPIKYPIIMDLFDYANYGHASIMDWDDPDLLERESKAIYQLMNYVYEWNLSNNNYDPVMMVQIGQGIDRFARWRIDAYKVLDQNGLIYNNTEAWNMINNYVNGVAKGVKYSKYNAITRVEFCEQDAVVSYVSNVYHLDNIDVVSATYLHTVAKTKSGIKSFADSFADMTVMNVENWANDINQKQILSTMAVGGTGYVSYQLASPLYFPESPNGALYNRYNANGATLAEKFTDKNNRAANTKQMNEMLGKAFMAVTNASIKNFAAFGLDNLVNNKTGSERYQKVYMSNGILMTFSNPVDSLGFAIYDDGYLYFSTTKNATLEITNCSVTVAQKGYFNPSTGLWTSEGNVSLTNNKTLSASANIVYRLKITGISSLPSTSNLQNSGYKNTLEIVRG